MNYMNDLGASKCFFCSFFSAFFFVLENSVADFFFLLIHTILKIVQKWSTMQLVFLQKFPSRQLLDENMVSFRIKSFDYIHFTNYLIQTIAHMDFHWKVCFFLYKKASFTGKFDKKNIRWYCGTLCRYGSFCQRGTL